MLPPRLELVTPPASEPITLAEGKAHLRVSSAAEDALITLWIIAARELVEAALRRKLITQHWRILRSSFCGPIVLPDVSPVSAVDSVKYIDTAGALQTLDAAVYQLVKSAPARLVLAPEKEWPELRGDQEGVRIEVTCGYGGAAAVPASIKAAILLVLGDLFERRGAHADYQVFEVPGVQGLLASHMVLEF